MAGRAVSGVEPIPAVPPWPWAHRPWCAPECTFQPGVAEGTHLGRAWSLAPAWAGQAPAVELRLFEQVDEERTGLVRVLLSVTERRLVGDLDPLAELRTVPGPVAAGLADISAGAELSVHQAGRVVEQWVAFARCARDLSIPSTRPRETMSEMRCAESGGTG